MEMEVKPIFVRGRYVYMALILRGCALFVPPQSDRRSGAFSLEQQGKVTEAEPSGRRAPAAGEGGEGHPRQFLGPLFWNRAGGKPGNLLYR